MGWGVKKIFETAALFNFCAIWLGGLVVGVVFRDVAVDGVVVVAV